MKKRLLILFTSLFLLTAAAGVITAYAVGAETFSLNGTVEEEYTLGETVSIPDATFTVSGVNYGAQHVVYFPDGTASSASSVTLSVRGNYTVDYHTTVNGVMYSREYKFSTEVPFGSFLTNKSSYNYWQNPDWDTLDGMGEYNRPTAKKWGTTVSIAKKDVFTVNEIIDLNNAETENPFITFYFMPQTFGELDATRFYVKLTDAFDSENSVTVEYRLGLGTWAYNVGKASGQVWAGLQARYANGSFTNYTAHVNNAYGSVIQNNGGGLHGRYGDGVQPVSLYYVSEERALYNNGYSFNAKLVDLDDEEYQSNPWKGFSSNYVYVSMWADSYNKDTFRVFITDLCGADLSADYVVDNVGPEITVNSKGVDVMALPNGGVGLNYKVFDATARDLYATTPLKTGRKVLLGYTRASGIYHTEGLDYTAEVDCSKGYFKPSRAGTYSVVYYATDYSGNYTEVVSNVNIVADYNDASYLTLAEATTNAQVGNRIPLAEVAEFGGYVGNYEIKYTLTKDGNAVAFDGNLVSGYTFVPETAGEYNVKVELTDLVGGGATQSYGVTVTPATMPSISDGADLPAYFISEYTYKLPVLYAYDYNNGMKKVKTNVSIKDGTGTWAYNGGEASFTPDANGFVEITYYISENRLTYKVPVVSIYEGSDIIVSKMFVLTDGAAEISSATKGVSVSSRNSDGTAVFVKQVLSKTFATELSVDTEKNDFTYLDVTLADSFERTDKITVSLKKESNGASVYINGIDTGKDIANVFASGDKITLSYSENSNSISLGDKKFYLTENYNGEAFDGFNSGYVYVSYGMRDVSSRSTFYVQKINNQTINSSVVEDKVKPEFSLNGVYENLVVEKGTTLTVWSAAYGDVLSNISSETVSVTFNGKNITDIYGNIMKNLSCDFEYAFKANEYGTYVISYLVKDSANRKQGYSYTVSVVDMVAPVITTDMKNGTASLGDKLTFSKNATAKDDRDGSVAVYVYVICPDYQILDLNNEDCFYAKEKGTYTVRYMALDSEGNTTYKDFEIVVE